MTDRQIKNRLDKLEALQAQVDALTKEADALKDEIKVALGDTQEKVVGNRKIFWKWRTGSRFDKKGFGMKYPDLLKEYTVATEPTRFWKVTEVKA